MQKVYLLLRSNKQSGPHTLDELLNFNLKPLDLVWVEGKSFGWSYPSEIESLKPFVEAPKEENSQKITQPSSQYDQVNSNTSAPAINKKIFVSMPFHASNTSRSDSKPLHNSGETEYDHQALERKAEELRLRAQAYASSKQFIKNNDVVEIKYAKTLEEVEEEYTSWMYKKNTKKYNHFSKQQLLSVLAVIIVLVGGWFIGSYLFSYGNTKITEGVVHVQNSTREENLPILMENSAEEMITHDISKHEIADNIQQANATIIPKLQQERILLPEKSEKESVENMVASAPIEDLKTPEIHSPNLDTEQPVVEVEQPKKKTLGESVSEVFKKLIKNDEAETKTNPSSGERKANRRGEVITAETDISDQVEVKMNTNTDNWMMGVIGLKLTLYNRSSISLKSAEIEVLYFNDQNKLIDKKRLTFSNIGPKKSQTISAPDHRLADHAEFKIITATGIQDAYAKN